MAAGKFIKSLEKLECYFCIHFMKASQCNQRNKWFDFIFLKQWFNFPSLLCAYWVSVYNIVFLFINTSVLLLVSSLNTLCYFNHSNIKKNFLLNWKQYAVTVGICNLMPFKIFNFNYEKNTRDTMKSDEFLQNVVLVKISNIPVLFLSFYAPFS